MAKKESAIGFTVSAVEYLSRTYISDLKVWSNIYLCVISKIRQEYRISLYVLSLLEQTTVLRGKHRNQQEHMCMSPRSCFPVVLWASMLMIKLVSTVYGTHVDHDMS